MMRVIQQHYRSEINIANLLDNDEDSSVLLPMRKIMIERGLMGRSQRRGIDVLWLLRSTITKEQ